MMTIQLKTLASALAVATALVIPSLAAAQPAHADAHGGKAPAGNSGSMDMMSVMQQGNQKMSSMTMTGDPDVDFAMMMRMHHMSAIQMAEIELRNGKDAKTKQMAKKIMASQKKEISEFETFLARHGHPVDKMTK